MDFIFDGPAHYFQPLPDFTFHKAVSSSPLYSPYAPYAVPAAPALVPPSALSAPAIKTEDFGALLECMTQMIITAIGMTCREPSAQRTYGNDTCNGCRQTGHYITDCPTIECMINEGKCRQNVEGHVILPGGGWVPRAIPGKHLAEHIEEWHRCNLNQIVEGRLSLNTNAQLIYDIAPLLTVKVPIQSTYVSASPPITPPMQQAPSHLTKEDHILVLE